MSTNRHKKIANTHYIVRTCMQTRINIGHSMVPPHQMVMSCGTNPRALRSVERPATLRKSLTDGRVQQTERFFFKVRKLLTDDTSHNPEVDFDVSYFVFFIFRHSSCQQKCPLQIRGNTWSLKIWSPIGHHFGRQIPQWGQCSPPSKVRYHPWKHTHLRCWCPHCWSEPSASHMSRIHKRFLSSRTVPPPVCMGSCQCLWKKESNGHLPALLSLEP